MSTGGMIGGCRGLGGGMYGFLVVGGTATGGVVEDGSLIG